MRKLAYAVLILTAILAVSDPAMAYETEREVQGLSLEQRRVARAKQEWLASLPPEPTPSPTPSSPPSYESYAGGVLSAEQVASYARGAGFPEDVIPTMVAIAARESGFDPGAVNGSSGACGLWQMYPCPGPEALNPATNAAMAFYKFQHGGLSHWGY